MQGNIDNITFKEAALHLLTMFWKVLCSTIPPKDQGGGWFAFCWALGYLTILTSILAEFAKLFSCVAGIPY